MNYQPFSGSNLTLIILFFIVGLAFLFFGFYIYKINRRIIKNGIKCKAVITDIEKKITKGMQGADDLSSIYFLYKVRYTTISGVQIEKFTNEGVQKQYQIGEEIDIIYNSKNETEFLAFQKSQNVLEYAFIFIGVLFILISVIFSFK